MIKRLAKTVLKTVAPNQFSVLSGERANKHIQRFLEQQGIPLITEKFVAKFGTKVQSGPFAGMNYVDASIGSSFIPKLIGSYECELHPIIEEIIAKSYSVVVDVGCAEGYYAVGLAMKVPGHPSIYAYDIDRDAQKFCKRLANANQVEDKVIISGFCDANELEKILKGKSLIICDCEGYEEELLDPTKSPALLTSEILVELHDTGSHPMAQVIEERFSKSHSVKLIGSVTRHPEDYPIVSFLDTQQQKVALSEFRQGNQQWAHLTPIGS